MGILETVKEVTTKTVELGAVQDVEKALDKAASKSDIAISQTIKAHSNFKVSIGLYENALSVVDKSLRQAKELGADDLVKKLQATEKRVKGYLAQDKIYFRKTDI